MITADLTCLAVHFPGVTGQHIVAECVSVVWPDCAVPVSTASGVLLR